MIGAIRGGMFLDGKGLDAYFKFRYQNRKFTVVNYVRVMASISEEY